MGLYDSMRQFADSWGLVGMMLFFLAAVGSVLRPGARAKADEAARIPLEDSSPKTCEGCLGNGSCARLKTLFEEGRTNG